MNVEVAWVGGETLRCSGNSFATPHIAGICALVRSKHPELTPFQLKSVLHLTASNVGEPRFERGPAQRRRRRGRARLEERFRELLRSVVEVARAIFAAKASSILLLDEEADELVFEAVVGEGEENLLGTRFPAGTGVAGWVLATRTPLVIEDVERDPRFAKDVAEGTGYVPQGLMAVPLLHDERALGVLEVLDRQSRFTLAEMELLGLFASQAAIALDLLQRAREAEAALSGAGELAVVARLAAALERLGDEARPAAMRLLDVARPATSEGVPRTRTSPVSRAGSFRSTRRWGR